MIGVFLKGIGLGLVLALLIGPVFFALIQTSIRQGISKAIFMALGICLSDASYIFLTYFGIAQFSNNAVFIQTMGVGGGIMLIIIGLVVMYKKPAHTAEIQGELTNKDRMRSFIKGYSLNFINPAVFLFWVGAVGAVSLDYDYSNISVFLFFLGTIITIFLTDLFKIYVASNLSNILNDRILYWINKTSGFLMVAYGLKLILEKFLLTN